ncbi:MAG: glycoside hydrolase family 3 N-terminal domain-containing protein [Bacteroidota bacterium]|nr:glycoside hydrolase family 3 N-terminal domain-containing protein [Bacteroidota bacterium]
MSCSSTEQSTSINGSKSRSNTLVADSSASLNQTHAWADSVLQQMSLREKVAQLFIIWTKAGFFANDEKQWQENLRYAQNVGVGGFYFSNGSAYGFPVNANKLQQISKIPLLMTADFEWGAGMRIQEATTFPRAMSLGATRDTNLAYKMGKATAREARALGIYQNYSPTVDINNNPKNPVINTRSFGEDPKLVSDFARAFIRGTQEENVIATVKHFPGHGDTDIDTHLDIPSINISRERFDSVELVPFKDAINNGVMSVMISHIHAVTFDDTNSLPSTASENIVTKLLKDELKFDGLIITDALAMKGVTKLFSPGEAAKRAVKAGADMLVMSPNTDEAIDSLIEAVQRGEITEQRINRSVKKILEYKQWCGLDTNRYVDVDAVSKVVANNSHKELAKEIARKSITVLGNEDGILPLRNLNGKKILDIVFSDTEEPEDAKELHEELFNRKRIELVRIDPRSNQMEYEDVLKKAKFADLIICQFMFYIRSEAMSGRLPKKASDLMTAIAALQKPIVTISTGNPYVAMDFPPVNAYVATFSPSKASIEAAAEVIFGEQPARGKLPITIPGRYQFGQGVEYQALILRNGEPGEAGFDADSLVLVDSIIEKAIADSAFPGAVLLVARNGIVAHEKSYGRFMYDSSSEKMTTDAIFDLASVTKVISTTSAVMRLVEEKKISLQDKVVKYFPAFGQNGKENVTIYNLLVHNSGLQAWRKYYEFCDTSQCVLDSIFVAPLIYTTGDSTLYSDLGLITIGKIIERVTKTTLANYVDSVFFKPLGMKNTMYNPPVELWKRVVPTEIDSFWKKTYTAVRGRVHDENAATLGGISGHAGLFSTASDLSKILQMELNYGIYNGKRYLDSATIAAFIKRQSINSSRGIGWDTRAEGRSFTGQYASPITFMHTGFTGTSVVVDPTKNIIVIFLTNRVYPTRSNLKILRVRPAVHDAIFKALK